MQDQTERHHRIFPVYENRISLGQILVVMPVIVLIATTIMAWQDLTNKVQANEAGVAKNTALVKELEEKAALRSESVLARIERHSEGDAHPGALARLARLEGEWKATVDAIRDSLESLDRRSAESRQEYRTLQAELAQIRADLGYKEDRVQPPMRR